MDYTIRNEFLTVTVSSDGGELRSILGADGTEYIWVGDKAFWGRHAPNLFPFVGRLANQTYRWEGKDYHLGIHGFVREQTLTAAEHTDTRLVMELTENETTLAQYPFPFRYQVIFALEGKSLSVTYRVENTGSGTLPFGLGAHPGFNVPLSGSGSFTDWTLTFAKPCTPRRVEVTDTGYVNGVEPEFPLEEGRILPLRHNLFDHDAIILREMDTTVTLSSPTSPHAVEVSFPDMQYVGFWHTPKTEAPFLCIEPWRTLPGRDGVLEDFGEKEDIIRLAPGAVYENTMTIRTIS